MNAGFGSSREGENQCPSAAKVLLVGDGMRRPRSSSIKKLCNSECPVGSASRSFSSSLVEW